MNNKHLPKVYAVILNYKCSRNTEECIVSLQSDGYPNLHFIVVDNNSNDGSVEYLQNRFPSIDIIDRNINDGYAGGNNEGIQYALERDSDYVLIINPDTIVTSNFIAPMVREMEEEKKIGIITGRAYNYYTKNIYNTGGHYSTLLCSVVPLPSHEIMKEQNVGFISGCVMLIRKDVFITVGLIDQKYFMYMEDVKYSLEVSKKYLLRYFPPSVLYHKSGGGNTLIDYTPFYLYYSTRNKLLFFTEQHPINRVYAFVIVLFLVVSKLVGLIMKKLQNSTLKIKAQLFALISGYIDGVLSISGRNSKY